MKQRPSTASRLLSLVGAAALALIAPAARAQVAGPRYYAVVNGDTLWSIAHRYHVPASELADRNRLREPFALRRGMRLRLPSRAAAVPDANPNAPVPTGAPLNHLAAARGTSEVAPRHPPPPTRQARAPDAPAPARNDNHRAGRGRWGRPRHPGVAHMVRVIDSEAINVDLNRIGPITRRRMRAFLRSHAGRSYPIDPRLLDQLRLVSDHFGGRAIEVISGFRPRRRRQWTAHSRHNIGHAVDFRVAGVSNRALRDYCRTFANTGCGFYPRSVFIHMDTREESAYWTDWSRPGERPRYGGERSPPAERRHPAANAHPADSPDPSVPPVGADPELDDVASEAPSVRTAPPPGDHDHDHDGDHENGDHDSAPAPTTGEPAP